MIASCRTVFIGYMEKVSHTTRWRSWSTTNTVEIWVHRILEMLSKDWHQSQTVDEAVFTTWSNVPISLLETQASSMPNFSCSACEFLPFSTGTAYLFKRRCPINQGETFWIHMLLAKCCGDVFKSPLLYTCVYIDVALCCAALGMGLWLSTGWMALRPCCALNNHRENTLAAVSHMWELHWGQQGRFYWL